MRSGEGEGSKRRSYRLGNISSDLMEGDLKLEGMDGKDPGKKAWIRILGAMWVLGKEQGKVLNEIEETNQGKAIPGGWFL